LLNLKIYKSFENFNDFIELQHVTYFSTITHFEISKRKTPDHEYLIKFLENNEKNLIGIHLGDGSYSTNLAIPEFCPNLKSLYTKFGNDEKETLIGILNGC